MVVQVEVKRSSEALWEAIAKSDDGRYLQKFEQWRAAGADVDQSRSVAVAIRTSGDEALDRPVRGLNRTPRALARLSAIELELGR